jgi:Family of unknown function (DUF6194)
MPFATIVTQDYDR